MDKFYVFTVSRHQNIIDMFEHTCDAGDGINTFLGAKFDDKEKCLEFAREVESLKYDYNETNFTIQCTKDPMWNTFVGFTRWEINN